MTTNDEFIGLLEEYLEAFDGVAPLPDRVRDAIHAELPGIRQVRPRPDLRRASTVFSETPFVARWAVAAALITAVALGAAIMAGGGRPNVPAPTPSPTAVVSPTQQPVALGSAPYVPCTPEKGVTCIEPGTYLLGGGLPRDARITVPAGWFEWDPGPGSAGVLVNRLAGPDSSGWGVLIMRVGDVARDPCDATAGAFPAADVDTPEELVAAMASWPGFSVTGPGPTTVGGVDGQRITVTSTSTPRDCGGGSIWQTPSATDIDAYPMVNAQAGAEHYPAEFRIIVIDGQLLAIRTMASAATSPFELQQGVPNDPERHAADLVALDSIVQSLRFADAASATPTALSGPTASD